jgi:hypothetical protein
VDCPIVLEQWSTGVLVILFCVLHPAEGLDEKEEVG